MTKTGTTNTTDIRADDTLRIEDDAASIPAQSTDDSQLPRDPRAEIMADIYANRNAQLERELGVAREISDASDQAADASAPEPESNAPADKPTDAPAAPIPSPASQPETDPQNVPAATAPQRRKLVINGREHELTQEEIDRAAQMGMASQQTWQEAAAMKKEALALYGLAQQQIQQAPASAQPAQPNSGQPKSGSVPLIDEDRLKRFDHVLNYGSDEERQAALRGFAEDVVNAAKGQANNGFTQEQVIAIATQNALAEIQRANTLNTVATEFNDVFQDAILSKTAGMLTQDLRQHYAALGQPKADLEIMREALGTIRTKYLKPSAPAPVDTTQNPNPPVQAAVNALQMNARTERKRAAPQPPAAANKVASEQAASSQPTGSQIVNQMRKWRHQSAYD